MNRLQKKCVIATAGFHLLLLTVLVFGSAFFAPRPKPDETQLLDVIPANLVDVALNSGVRQAAPPPPAPIITPPPQPTPPTPTIQPPPPVPKPVVPPSPTITERIEKLFTPEPKPLPAKPVPEKPEPRTHQIQVNTQLVARTPPKPSTTPDNSQQTARTLNNTIKTLRDKLSSPTEVTLSGNSTVAYANYGNVVTSVYHQKWITLEPAGMEKDNAVVIFKVTIASDGTVISARIVTPSGDANVDRAVQRMLDSVTMIAPFPGGATEKERVYTINFNAIRTTE